MADVANLIGASKSASTLLVLFIPSCDRDNHAIDQSYWVDESLAVLGRLFGGATAFPQGRGVWRDDSRGGQLLFDEPVIVQCYTAADRIEAEAEKLRSFLVRLGTEGNQAAIGFVIDGDYLEIPFPKAGA